MINDLLMSDHNPLCRLPGGEIQRYPRGDHQSLKKKGKSDTSGQGQAVFDCLKGKSDLEAFTRAEETTGRECQ